MEEYLRSPRAPTGRLLFPGASLDEPIGDWRKPLDEIAMVAGFEPEEVRSIRFRPTLATHRAYTCDEVGQPMSALKLLAEMGHGSVKMLEERYFNAARFRRPRPHLERPTLLAASFLRCSASWWAWASTNLPERLHLLLELAEDDVAAVPPQVQPRRRVLGKVRVGLGPWQHRAAAGGVGHGGRVGDLPVRVLGAQHHLGGIGDFVGDGASLSSPDAGCTLLFLFKRRPLPTVLRLRRGSCQDRSVDQVSLKSWIATLGCLIAYA